MHRVGALSGFGFRALGWDRLSPAAIAGKSASVGKGMPAEPPALCLLQRQPDMPEQFPSDRLYAGAGINSSDVLVPGS
ncbi:hypothetical protein AU467_04000 [Mesorhizobium loti]|uniref:Uncharacterized protein n=1 Tax=Rhizobium loti TaxID=381 RepID=A0A101KSF7_RHILI|nr:hypothetical protein AU467_04000 [Mesorhizobium loti]